MKKFDAIKFIKELPTCPLDDVVFKAYEKGIADYKEKLNKKIQPYSLIVESFGVESECGKINIQELKDLMETIKCKFCKEEQIKEQK